MNDSREQQPSAIRAWAKSSKGRQEIAQLVLCLALVGPPLIFEGLRGWFLFGVMGIFLLFCIGFFLRILGVVIHFLLGR